jgi:hypothetical protein
MTSHILATCLSLVLVLVPGAVFCMAARRLRMSRSRNAALYWLTGGFAFAGAAGAAQTGLAGAQMDAGGMVMAAASLPLWLLVRVVTARARSPYAPGGPIFTSVRRDGLRKPPPRLTQLA